MCNHSLLSETVKKRCHDCDDFEGDDYYLTGVCKPQGMPVRRFQDCTLIE